MQTRPLLRDTLTDRLRTFVLEQRSDVTVRISPERELAEMLGVSRISVRHALKNLVTEGLLVQKQGSGTYVVPRTRLDSVQVLMARDIKQNDPFFNEFLAEVTHYCAENAIQLKVTREGSLGDLRSEGSPLVIVGLLADESVVHVKKMNRTIVSTQYYPDFLEISQILFNDSRIGWDAAEVLYEHGHSRVIHLSGPDAYPSARDRKHAFIEGARKRGMVVTTLQGKMNWQSGYELGATVMELLRSEKPPTAVFASNDWIALGLMHRLAEDRIRIPDQLSIIGCDDIHISAEISPGLTTFRWDMDFMVRELFGVINAEMVANAQSHKRVLLPARFVKRGSIRALREA